MTLHSADEPCDCQARLEAAKDGEVVEMCTDAIQAERARGVLDGMMPTVDDAVFGMPFSARYEP